MSQSETSCHTFCGEEVDCVAGAAQATPNPFSVFSDFLRKTATYKNAFYEGVKGLLLLTKRVATPIEKGCYSIVKGLLLIFKRVATVFEKGCYSFWHSQCARK